MKFDESEFHEPLTAALVAYANGRGPVYPHAMTSPCEVIELSRVMNVLSGQEQMLPAWVQTMYDTLPLSEWACYGVPRAFYSVISHVSAEVGIRVTLIRAAHMQ